MANEWSKDIINHLDKCNVFIFLASDMSINSHNCQNELSRAVKKNKPFINLICEKLDELNENYDDFDFNYGRFQQFPLYSYRDDMKDVVRHLEMKLDSTILNKLLECVKEKKSKEFIDDLIHKMETSCENNNISLLNEYTKELLNLVENLNNYAIDCFLKLYDQCFFEPDNDDEVYNLVIKLLHKLCSLGNSHALYSVGYMFIYTSILEKQMLGNITNSSETLLETVKFSTLANKNVTVKKVFEEGIKYLEKSANLGYDLAIIKLGKIYAGLHQTIYDNEMINYDVSRRWFEKLTKDKEMYLDALEKTKAKRENNKV